MCEKFDAMICPSKFDAKPNEVKTIGRLFTSLKDYVTGSNADEKSKDTGVQDAIPINDFKQMRKLCLEIYLHDDLNLLTTGSIQKDTDLLKLFSGINNVYNCLQNPFVNAQKNLKSLLSPLKNVRRKVLQK